MTTALGFLVLAATLGSWLAVGVIRGTATAGGPKGWMVGLLHGAAGATGLAVLVLALGGRRAPAGMGLGGFGTGAEILLGLTLVLGLLVASARWRGRRPAGLVIGTHATFAIGAIALVLAIVALG